MNPYKIKETFKSYPKSIKEIERECMRAAVAVFGEKVLKTFKKCTEVAGPDYQFDSDAEGGWNRFYIGYDMYTSASSIDSITINILDPKKYIPFKG